MNNALQSVNRKMEVDRLPVGLEEQVAGRKSRQQDKRGNGVEGFDRRA